MIKIRILICIFCYYMAGCVINERAPRIPECIDPCQTEDTGVFDIENVDDYNVYIKYGYSDLGNIAPVTLKSTVVSNRSMLKGGLPFNNQKFNFLYFFSGPQMQEQDFIGSFIIKNSQPTNTTLCKLRVQFNGSFSSSENRFVVTNTLGEATIKHAQLSVSYLVNLDNIGEIFRFGGQCGSTRINTAPSSNFHHLYFYDKEGSAANENNLLSKIIYKNTKSDKININGIVIK